MIRGRLKGQNAMNTLEINKTVKARMKWALAGASRRSSLPILSNGLIYPAGEGLGVRSTDLDVTTIAEFSEVFEPRAFALSAAGLGKLVAGLKGGEVRFSPNCTACAVTSSAGSLSLPMLPADEFPPVPVASELVGQFDAAAVIGALRQVEHAQSTDQTRYILNGVCLEIGHESAALIAADGKRLRIASVPRLDPTDSLLLAIMRGNLANSEAMLGEVETAERGAASVATCPTVIKARDEVIAARAKVAAAREELGKVRRIVVPSAAVALLLKMPVEPGALVRVSVGVNEAEKEKPSFVRFECGPCALVSKQVDGTFPNWRQCVPVDCKERVQFDAAELIAVIKAGSAASTQKETAVRFSFTKHLLTVSSKSEDCGEASASVAINYPFADFATALNPDYAAEAVKSFVGLSPFTLEWTDELTPVVFRAGDSFEVLMPMRMN